MVTNELCCGVVVEGDDECDDEAVHCVVMAGMWMQILSLIPIAAWCVVLLEVTLPNWLS